MNREEYQEYLKSEAWQIRRRWKLEQADHRCQVCNSDGLLEVHHRTYERVGNERMADLTVLCRECHGKFHDEVTSIAPSIGPPPNILAIRFVNWCERNPFEAKSHADIVQKFIWWTDPMGLGRSEFERVLSEAFEEANRRGYITITDT